MKKLLFTALAVVAFSGVSMANSAEAKESETKKLKINFATFQEQETPCQAAAVDEYLRYINDGVDQIDVLNYLLSKCT